ncbi:glycosyltransferase family 2 protein [Robertmurraya korlensis]|uniref:glycosyltransferase family 2 protein n=1 Tax=Robertmurraya korlensis TaxID=519977 RepID=UPI00203EA20D|nr:glycosyltransferase family 2 protein [Robertmurraya korlensis]MCM3601582.1 glycosyltransferase family 2 protein [Robertmurraya korlensis]
MKPTNVTIVVPCYNEEEILHKTFYELSNLLTSMVDDGLVSPKSKILFVDDGSLDQTWKLIYKETLKNGMIKGVKLSRNVGHQNAILAGIHIATESSDAIITIDADLQDDIYVMREFIVKYQMGYEVIYGVREKRDSDTFFKRFTAESFYKLMNKMGVELIYNHADYRLLSRRAAEYLQGFEEVNMFLRGIIPLLGFRSTKVFYERKERTAGESKYPLRKMLSFAFNGVTSFSVTPIRLVLVGGLVSFFISLFFALYFLSLKLFGNTELGWTSLITSIWLIGGLQLIAIGLIGEYIGKIYKESKRRPKYIVDIDMFKLPLGRNLALEEDQELFKDDHMGIQSLSEYNN